MVIIAKEIRVIFDFCEALKNENSNVEFPAGY
jgi:hypothetical protein